MGRLLFATSDDISTIFIRLALGIAIFPHGAQKVLGWFGGPGMAGTIQIFTEKLHFPLWSVVILLVLEFLGSIGFVIGFLSRLTALGLTCSMVICANMDHIQNGFFMNWYGQQKGEGIEYHVLVLGMCLFLLFHGSGGLSIDRTIMKALGKK